MTNGIYLNLRFNPVMPTPMSAFIQACIKSPKQGLRFIGNYPELSEHWLALWGNHPAFPAWTERSFIVSNDGIATLQLASASDVSSVNTLKSFIEWVLPYTVSTGLVGIYITKPWIEYPKLLTVRHGKLQCQYCSRWADLSNVTPDLAMIEKIKQLPQLIR